MNSKVEFYTIICEVMNNSDIKETIWDILSGYTINKISAYSSLDNSIEKFLDAKRADK